MIGVSDIPDWVQYECFGNGFDYRNVMSDDELVKMRAMSPIAYSHNVTAPTLMNIGWKDNRVPPPQVSI